MTKVTNKELIKTLELKMDEKFNKMDKCFDKSDEEIKKRIKKYQLWREKLD
jgi:hypothetical protein